jgi:hypothetical protein
MYRAIRGVRRRAKGDEMSVRRRDRVRGQRPPIASSLEVERRTFLKWVGVTAGANFVQVTACNSEGSPDAAVPATPDFSATLLRRDDLLSLKFDFYNSVLNPAGTAIVPKGSGDRFMVVTFGPQHVIEAVLSEDPPPFIIASPNPARIAGSSRLAFRVPAAVAEIPFTPDDLLGACASYELSVSMNALPPPTPRVDVALRLPLPDPKVGDSSNANIGISSDPSIQTSLNGVIGKSRALRGATELARSSNRSIAAPAVDPLIKSAVDKLAPTTPVAPSETETAIELPYRLLLSPNAYGQWAHAVKPVTSPQGRVELWHTRLGVRTANGQIDESSAAAPLRTVRALWTREPNFSPGNPCTYATAADPAIKFATAMSSSDRIVIVHQSSNFAPATCVDPNPFPGPKSSVVPEPIHVDRMMLTTLGGFLDSQGDWGSSPLYGIESWKHRAALGRDNYVEIVYRGVLYPFGHRASLVKITERKLNSLAPHTAFLWQRYYIVVREPLVTYDDQLRQFPFSQLHIKTLATPNLSNPPDPKKAPAPFIPEVASRTFRFAAEGLDREGNLIKLELAVAWVPAPDGKVRDEHLTSARMIYVGDDARASGNGQRIALAKGSRPDDTTFEVESFDFAEPSGGPAPPTELNFLPAITQAALKVEAIRHLAGQDISTAFKYASDYLLYEFSAKNAGQLMMDLAGGVTPPNLDFSKKSDRSGGFVAPSMAITGLSRLTGPVAGDLKMIVQNKFDPSSFLSGFDAKLFGVFNLKEVIQAVASGNGGLLRAPKFITQGLNQVEEFLQDLADLEGQANKLEADLKAEVMMVEGAITAAITNIGTTAKAIITDIAAIRLDLDKIDGDIDKVTNVDLPAFVTALTSAAALFGMAPVPAQLQKLGDGPRKMFKQRLDQMSSVVAMATKDLHDVIKAFRTGADMLKNLTVKLDWRPPIQGFPMGAPIFAPNKPDAFLLAVEVRAKDSKGKPAGVDLLCSLEHFEIRLIAPATFLILKFQKVSFSMTSGKKPDIDVVFDDLVFDGCLAFVEQLKKLIPLGGFSDPPNVDISTEGIKAKFSLAIPSATVGVFALTNLSFSAGFHIPFIGNPLSVTFQFCTRENPFHLTVECIGGGGFFGIEVSPGDVIVLEAALEFGAEASLDLGVVSGAVSIMAGIYFRMEAKNAQITGYLRIRGDVEVLGLITSTIELYMELTYEFTSHKIIGRAKLEITVSIAFFSIDVSITVERKFGGSNSDPSFEDVMKPALGYNPFADYLAAFDVAA